jgi:hypothetical protein
MYQVCASSFSNFACVFEVFEADTACSLIKFLEILIFILKSVCYSILKDCFFPSDKIKEPRFRETIFIGHRDGIGSPQSLVYDIVGGGPAISKKFGR